MSIAATFADTDAREQLLNIRVDALPAVERAVDSARAMNLRSIKNEKHREQVKALRIQAAALLHTLREIR